MTGIEDDYQFKGRQNKNQNQNQEQKQKHYHHLFQLAANHIKIDEKATNLSNNLKLELYGLYKIVNDGKMPITLSRYQQYSNTKTPTHVINTLTLDNKILSIPITVSKW